MSLEQITPKFEYITDTEFWIMLAVAFVAAGLLLWVLVRNRRGRIR